MNMSNTIAKIAEAMAKAQAEMPHVPMNSVNPFLKNKFADLGAVISTIRPVLSKYGLSFSQLPVSENGKVGIATIVMHSSGEWLESVVLLDLADEKGKSAAQVAGSVITYLRRYSLAAAFGLYSDEDSDGSQPGKKQEEKKEEKKDLTETEKKQIVMDKYTALHARAKAVKLEIPALDESLTSAQMKAQYTEQKAFVESAEEQAKVGE